MGLLNGLWLAVLGVLGASSLIIAKKPDAKELIGKLAPYQGWIGAISAFWGIYEVIWSLSLMHWFIWFLTVLVAGVIQICLGLLLGVGVLKSFIKNADVQAKMDQAIAKLAPYQGNLGLASIALGVWVVIESFLLI